MRARSDLARACTTATARAVRRSSGPAGPNGRAGPNGLEKTLGAQSKRTHSHSSSSSTIIMTVQKIDDCDKLKELFAQGGKVVVYLSATW